MCWHVVALLEKLEHGGGLGHVDGSPTSHLCARETFIVDIDHRMWLIDVSKSVHMYVNNTMIISTTMARGFTQEEGVDYS